MMHRSVTLALTAGFTAAALIVPALADDKEDNYAQFWDDISGEALDTDGDRTP